jgi:hypothetical protein
MLRTFLLARVSSWGFSRLIFRDWPQAELSPHGERFRHTMHLFLILTQLKEELSNPAPEFISLLDQTGRFALGW